MCGRPSRRGGGGCRTEAEVLADSTENHRSAVAWGVGRPHHDTLHDICSNHRPTLLVRDTTVQSTTPYHTIPYHTVPHRTVPDSTTPHQTTIPYNTRHRTTPLFVFSSSALARSFFFQFHYDVMVDAELQAKPQVLLLGHYSTGKTSVSPPPPPPP